MFASVVVATLKHNRKRPKSDSPGHSRRTTNSRDLDNDAVRSATCSVRRTAILVRCSQKWQLRRR